MEGPRGQRMAVAKDGKPMKVETVDKNSGTTMNYIAQKQPQLA